MSHVHMNSSGGSPPSSAFSRDKPHHSVASKATNTAVPKLQLSKNNPNEPTAQSARVENHHFLSPRSICATTARVFSPRGVTTQTETPIPETVVLERSALQRSQRKETTVTKKAWSLSEEEELKLNELTLSVPCAEREFCEEELISNLESYIVERILQGKTNAHRAVLRFYENLKMHAIHARLEEAQAQVKSPFTSHFLDIQKPATFISEFARLPQHEKETLLHLIGGEHVLASLGQGLDKKRKKEWENFAEKVTDMYHAIPHLHAKTPSHPVHFDHEKPIAKIKREEIFNALHEFLSTEQANKEPAVFIKGKKCLIPELKMEEESERKYAFVQWLIGVFNNSLGEKDDSSLPYQTALICYGVFGNEKREGMIAQLTSLFKKYGTQKNNIPTLLKHFDKNHAPKHSHKWLENNLPKLIQKIKDPEALVSMFEEEQWFRACAKHIPCFRILQAFSFSASSQAPLIMQSEYSPRLTRAHIESVPVESARYQIEIEAKDKTFTIVNRKKYQIVTKEANNLTLYGSLYVFWNIRGAAFSDSFSASITTSVQACPLGDFYSPTPCEFPLRSHKPRSFSAPSPKKASGSMINFPCTDPPKKEIKQQPFFSRVRTLHNLYEPEKDKIFRSEELYKSGPGETTIKKRAPALSRENAQRLIEMSLHTPALKKESWEKSLLNKLESYVVSRVLQRKTNAKRSVSKFLKYESLGSTTVQTRLKETLEKDKENSFIEYFLEIHNPAEFLSAYQLLRSHEQEALRNLIGGKEVLLCLSLLTENERKKEWEIFAKKVINMCQAVPHLRSKVLNYLINFDNRTISRIKGTDIVDSYRYYFARDYDNKEPAFFINDKQLFIPKIRKKSENERRYDMMAWLISELNSAFGEKTDAASLHFQTTLICSKAIEEQKRGEPLEQHLRALLCKYGNSAKSVGAILHNFDEHEAQCSERFNKWLHDNLAQILKEETDISALDLISMFKHKEWLKQCTKHIPCFRVLQALSFSAFYQVPIILKNEYSPRLCSSNVEEPRLKTLPTDPTRYRIEIDPEHKSFTVTHRKQYRIVSGETNKLTSHGNLYAFWNLRGAAFSDLFSATLKCDNLALSEEYPLEGRLKIVHALGLQLKSV